MFATISIAGKQIRVEEGKEYTVILPAEQKNQKKISFSEILELSNDGKSVFGNPTIDKANVEAEVIQEFSGEKTNVFKFHSKKRYTRNKSQRQKMAQIKILKISHEAKK